MIIPLSFTVHTLLQKPHTKRKLICLFSFSYFYWNHEMLALIFSDGVFIFSCLKKKTDQLIADDFSAELAEGLAYVAGHDDESRPVVVISSPLLLISVSFGLSGLFCFFLSEKFVILNWGGGHRFSGWSKTIRSYILRNCKLPNTREGNFSFFWPFKNFVSAIIVGLKPCYCFYSNFNFFFCNPEGSLVCWRSHLRWPFRPCQKT